ncbi:putative secreted protein [Granulibacter bethesdensis]|uniref:Secreted protein n=2 Tax=Granulibacter bethesdensis TaxID=364410 RepID=A0AAN0RC24_9PROT|nr:putative secreted protein [Granulibacter bethesdensis]
MNAFSHRSAVALLLAITAATVHPSCPVRAADMTHHDAAMKGASLAFHPPDRLFGYYIGDVLDSTVDITLAKGETLDLSTVPTPGDINYWLTLRRVDVIRHKRADGGEQVRLTLQYQTFYDPLEPKKLPVPGFTLVIHGAGADRKLSTPTWQFLSSPIREVSPGEDVDASFLQPDHWPPLPDVTIPRRATLAALGVALLSLIWLGWLSGWFGTVLRRRSRPFGFAVQQIRRERGREEREAYRNGLKALHEAFNRTEGGLVLAEDVPGFIIRHQRFSGLKAEIEQFFEASRRCFYASDVVQAMQSFPPQAVLALARQLRRSERA